MLTNDRNTQILINKILANKYEIDLIRVNVFKGDEKFSGKGIIYQDDEGQLQLKFFSDKEYNTDERLMMLMQGHNSSLTEGTIISKFYTMAGKDENNREYICDQIDLINFVDNVMNFRLLGSLNSSKEEGSSTRVILAGKHHIPKTGIVNRITKIDEKYWFTDNEEIWIIETENDFRILVTNYADYLDVLVQGNEEIEFNDVEDILNSLNFVLGIESEPIFINVSKKGHEIRNRFKILNASSAFTAPLISDHNYGNDFTENHNNMYRTYFKFIRQDPLKNLPIIHRRIVSGSRNYIYAEALILSVQIEKIIKDYYFHYQKTDEKIDSSLNNKNQNNRSNYNVNDILRKLAEQNIISKSLIKNWRSLRNITAHGDSYKGNEVTHLLDNMFLCTNLYYQLIFHLIGYEGKYSWKEYADNRIESYPLKKGTT